MTEMLASVNSLEEALLIKDLNVDIIDLKQPAEGALGALDINTVQQIVKTIGGDKPVSATVGDLPMHPEVVYEAVTAMQTTGVDYIKIGFFPGNDWQGTVEKLSSVTANHALIAVLFADTQPDLSIIPRLQQAGFKGVMLDTMDKHQGSLTALMTEIELAQFVQTANHHRLLTGLAGSLRQVDIAGLLPLNADYLGFRGALCEQHNRVARLNKEKIINIMQYFSKSAMPATASLLPTQPAESPIHVQ